MRSIAQINSLEYSRHSPHFISRGDQMFIQYLVLHVNFWFGRSPSQLHLLLHFIEVETPLRLRWVASHYVELIGHIVAPMGISVEQHVPDMIYQLLAWWMKSWWTISAFQCARFFSERICSIWWFKYFFRSRWDCLIIANVRAKGRGVAKVLKV